MAFAPSIPMSRYRRYAEECQWAAAKSCASLPPTSNMALVAPPPSPSALSHPRPAAAHLNLSVRRCLVGSGRDRPPVCTLRRTGSRDDHAGQDSCGTYISSEPAGQFSQIHFLTILGPRAARFSLRASIARCPPHVPITAGASRAESSSSFSRGRCLANGRHSDWARNKKRPADPRRVYRRDQRRVLLRYFHKKSARRCRSRGVNPITGGRQLLGCL